MKIIRTILANKKWISILSGALAVALFVSVFALARIHPWDNHSETSSDSLISDTEDSGHDSSAADPTGTPSSSEAAISQNTSSASSSASQAKDTEIKGTVTNNNVTVTTINQAKKLPKFKSYQEILTLLKEMGVTYEGYYRGGAIMDDAEVRENQADTAAPTAGDSSKGSDYSSTNTQVSGIDEGDIIKNDGEYLYIAGGNVVSIVKAYPADEMKKTSTIQLDPNESVQELYLQDDLLTLVCVSYEQIMIEPVILPETTPEPDSKADVSDGTASREAEPAVDAMPAIWYMGRQLTVIKVYDITDKAAPALKRTLKFDGYLTASRVKDGRFYLVTNQYIPSFPESQVKPEDILPSYSDSASGKGDIVIPAESVEYCPENVSANFILVSCFDIGTMEPATVETVLGAGNTIYMSSEALYIVQPFYRYYTTTVKDAAGTADQNSDPQKPDTSVTGTAGEVSAVEPEPIVVSVADEGTVVMKFALTDTGVKFSVAGEVHGQILNQYSMDEYAGTFRIATTQWTMDGTVNNLYVLDAAMKVKGKIEDLAKGERIYAVRFIGKTGYIVTFRNMDPLFVIDLSNPAAPRVAGELSIPGFSNYLHPVSDTLLMGIGQNTVTLYTKDEYGNETVVGSQQSGLKVSLFDVSDPTDPKEVSFLAIGGAGSNSEAQYNPKAFVWWASRSTALFPAYVYGKDGGVSYDEYYNAKSGAIAIAVENGKLVEKARLFPNNTSYGYYGQSRAVYIDNVIYISMNGGLYAYDAGSMQEIGRITVTEGYDGVVKDGAVR